MSCKVCSSHNLEKFSAELSVAFPGVQRLHLSPVYICQKTLVCLDCGYTELVIPAADLANLRKGMERSHSRNQLTVQYSRLL